MGERNLEQLFRNPVAFKANLLMAAFGGLTELNRQAWLGFGDSPSLFPLAKMLGGDNAVGGLLGTMMSTYLNQLQQIIAAATRNPG